MITQLPGFIRPLLAGLVWLSFLAGSEAATIILDEFNGAGALGGQAPTTPQTPGDTWVTNGSGLTTDSGALLLALGSYTSTATLPFSIGTGVYRLSADIDVTGPSADASSNFIGIGFANSSTPNFFSANAAPWLFTRLNGGGNAFGSGISQQFANWDSAPISAGLHNYVVQLDTTGAQWKAEVFIDGASYGIHTYTTNPTVTHVFIGRYGMSGNADNFAVDLVPEPSAGVLGALAAGLVLVRIRRRRA